jgi:hypothetical protein
MKELRSGLANDIERLISDNIFMSHEARELNYNGWKLASKHSRDSRDSKERERCEREFFEGFEDLGIWQTMVEITRKLA